MHVQLYTLNWTQFLFFIIHFRGPKKLQILMLFHLEILVTAKSAILLNSIGIKIIQIIIIVLNLFVTVYKQLILSTFSLVSPPPHVNCLVPIHRHYFDNQPFFVKLYSACCSINDHLSFELIF